MGIVVWKTAPIGPAIIRSELMLRGTKKDREYIRCETAPPREVWPSPTLNDER